jgi:hypothetical protein
MSSSAYGAGGAGGLTVHVGRGDAHGGLGRAIGRPDEVRRRERERARLFLVGRPGGERAHPKPIRGHGTSLAAPAPFSSAPTSTKEMGCYTYSFHGKLRRWLS